jgi:hypothetical protein
MTKAADHDALKAPPMRVLLRPSCFSERWENRPRETVKIGLRRATADELLSAHVDAARDADRLHPGTERDTELWQTTFQVIRFHHVLGYVITDENDVSEPPPFWSFLDGSIMIAPSPTGGHAVSRFFTRDGLGRLHDALELLALEDNPTWTPASNDKIDTMVGQLDDGTFFSTIAPGAGPDDAEAMEERRAAVEKQIRRLFAYAIHLHDTGFTKPIMY